MAEPEFAEVTVMGSTFQFRNADAGLDRTVTLPIVASGLVKKGDFLYAVDGKGRLWYENPDEECFVSPCLRHCLNHIKEHDRASYKRAAKAVLNRKRELDLETTLWDVG